MITETHCHYQPAKGEEGMGAPVAPQAWPHGLCAGGVHQRRGGQACEHTAPAVL